MLIHTLITINAVIGENNVRSMTFITMLFHLPNNMTKSFGSTYDQKNILLWELQNKLKIYNFPGKNDTKIRIMYHEGCYSHH